MSSGEGEVLVSGEERPDLMSEALRLWRDDQLMERLARITHCPVCGLSATGAERDLLAYARAMNFALNRIKLLAESDGRAGHVLTGRLLEALNEPYPFPLPGIGGELADPIAVSRADLLTVLDYARQFDVDDDPAVERVTAAARGAQGPNGD